MSEIKDFLYDQHFPRGLSNSERKKLLQKTEILQYLYQNGISTNIDIYNTFKISAPTSMALLNQLVKDGLVKKNGLGKSAGGRRPDLFCLEKNIFFVLSVHVERFRIRLAILNNDHEILFEESIPIIISATTEIVDLLMSHATELISRSKIDRAKLMGVGISMPGLVSEKLGRNLVYFLKDQEQDSLRNILEKKMSKPVILCNDANSACLAEFRFGLAKDKKDVLMVSMDWGIGLGIIMGGKFQPGTSGFAGELGHIPIEENGALCYCGKTGCLETTASGLALVKIAKERLKEGQASVLANLPEEELENLKPEMVIEAANKGDRFAIHLLSEIGYNLGKGLAILIQIFNPELIILGGQIAEANQFITTPVQQSINIYAKIQLKEQTQVVLSELGKKSSLLGLSSAVMDKIFKDRTEVLSSDSCQ